jgi:predicted nuclease with RNAse H fold
MRDVLGLHLVQGLDMVPTPRRSALARLDHEGRLTALDLAGPDEEILALVEPIHAVALVVDAPLEVPDDRGRRDVEVVLAWCDITAFPVSLRLLEKVYGGARGLALAPALDRPGRALRETIPDAVLRQIAWERDHPAGAAPLDLADYRARGTGRARPDGIVAAWRLLAEVLDLGGWTPGPPSDDWSAINDAARIDALCCAYAGLRMQRVGASASIGAPGHGQLTLPADANLAGRIALTLERLRAEGAIRI